MKTAKEMFEDLGYEIIVNDSMCIQYKRIVKETRRFYIAFMKVEKRYIHFGMEDIEEPMYFLKTFTYNLNIPFELHKAINKQLEELGWLEEDD